MHTKTKTNTILIAFILVTKQSIICFCLLKLPTLNNYFIPFCATGKTITPDVLWMTRWHCCTRLKAEGNSASGRPQHRGCYSFDCYTERYEIVVLLPNSEFIKGNNKRNASGKFVCDGRPWRMGSLNSQ